MIRWFPTAAFVVLLFWPFTLTALAFDWSAHVVRSWGDVAAGLTVAWHLSVALWLRFTQRRPCLAIDPGWAWTQVEKHRRKGVWFAGWGALAALAWLLVRPDLTLGGSIAWPVWGIVAGNLGFQSGLLGAEALVVNAWVKLGQVRDEPLIA